MTFTAEALAIGYGARTVGRGIDFTVRAGEVLCLLGPNGSGKTTLFKTLLALLPPLAGRVLIDGCDLSRQKRDAIAHQVAYVPQAQTAAFPYSVRDMVLMGRAARLPAFATPSAADRDIAGRALETLGIARLSERVFTEISGGERQLALIARALAQDAPMLIMDEPTASLDLGNRLLVLDKVRALSGEGLSVIISTHEPEQAFAIADSVAVMGRESRFVVGPVKTVLTSQELSRLYGVDLKIEATSSGRFVVGPASVSPRGR